MAPYSESRLVSSQYITRDADVDVLSMACMRAWAKEKAAAYFIVKLLMLQAFHCFKSKTHYLLP